MPIGECGHSVTRKGVKKCRDCWVKRGPDRPPETWIPASDSRRVPIDYDDALAQYRQFIGCSDRDYAGPAKARDLTGKCDIAVLSDLHAPFQDMRAVAAFLERTKGADLCIVAGDLQDHYSISRFLKYESVSIQSELASAQMVMEKLSEAFPRVICIEGNHDTPRFEKMLSDRLPHEAIDIIRFLSKTGRLSTVEALCNQFPNVEHVKNRVQGRFDVSWYAQVGDLVVTHAEKYSRVPGATMRGLEEWVSDFENTLGLKPWRVLLQAHTHQLSLFPWRSDKLLGETGCMCTVMGYQLSARVAGRPQRMGWQTLTQYDGVSDFGTVRPYWYQP